MKHKETYLENMPDGEKKRISNLVWAKSHKYPYWPCVILHPADLLPQMRKSAYGKQNNSTNSHLVRYLGYDSNLKEGKIGYVGSVKFDKIKKWNATTFKLFGDEYEAKISSQYLEVFRLAMNEVETYKEEINRKRKQIIKMVKVEDVKSNTSLSSETNYKLRNENDTTTITDSIISLQNTENDTGSLKNNVQKIGKSRKRKRNDEKDDNERKDGGNKKKKVSKKNNIDFRDDDNTSSIELASVPNHQISLTTCSPERRQRELDSLVKLLTLFANPNPFKNNDKCPAFIIDYYDDENQNIQHLLTKLEACGIANFIETYVYKRRRGKIDDKYISHMKQIRQCLYNYYQKADENFFSDLFHYVLIKRNKIDAKAQIKKMINFSLNKP